MKRQFLPPLFLLIILLLGGLSLASSPVFASQECTSGVSIAQPSAVEVFDLI